MSWTQEKVQETVQAIMAKAAADAEFRALAISDINEAIKQASGMEVPASFRVQVVDGAGYHATVVLPELRAAQDELTESELESVAGGSKSGATEFFNDVGSTITNTATTVGNTVAGGVQSGWDAYSHAVNQAAYDIGTGLANEAKKGL